LVFPIKLWAYDIRNAKYISLFSTGIGLHLSISKISIKWKKFQKERWHHKTYPFQVMCKIKNLYGHHRLEPHTAFWMGVRSHSSLPKLGDILCNYLYWVLWSFFAIIHILFGSQRNFSKKRSAKLWHPGFKHP
jgi:hypothetical protein